MPSLSAARRILRATGLVGAVAAIAVVGYYTQTVLEARRETPTIVKALLESKAIQLELREFPEGWLDMLLVVEDPGFYAHDGMDLSTPGAGITTSSMPLPPTPSGS